ncbi:uncharacterized protein DEA37_0012376 [Paragonimus westermani]|uniref:Dolichyl-diphosphooligosaccharide-protein glycosyltransferase subunit TMEM258 n=1 Tax=Paragonimus westermani TaxID=34504 RepID=A0A5J4NCA2_9TREM|nr:uncharacterized protein DEA37_0012376 [Paragonimus westermani]
MDPLVDRYTSPVNPAAYPTLAVTLLTIGTFFVAWFCAYELTANKYSRVLRKEMMLAGTSSIFMGLGAFFLLLWVGIYV